MNSVLRQVAWAVAGLVSIAAMTGMLEERLQKRTLGWLAILGILMLIEIALICMVRKNQKQ